MDAISITLSGAFTQFFGSPFRLGTAVSGTWILVLGVGVLSVHWLHTRRSGLRAILGCAGLLIGQQLYFLVLRFIPVFHSEMALVNTAGVYLLIVVAILMVIVRHPHIPARTTSMRAYPAGILLGASVLFVSMLLAQLSLPERNAHPYRILIDGRQAAISLSVPEFEETEEGLLYGPFQGASIGSFVEYLGVLGHSVDVQGKEAASESNGEDAVSQQALPAESLAGYDILVLINRSASMSQEERDTIADFVATGGGLLVLGDHTSMFVDPTDFAVGRDYLNEVLAFTGIQFRVDSAEPTGIGWRGKLELSSWPLDLSWFNATEVGISVGASLTTSGTAAPIVTGRYAFSDQADPEAPGYLGNREYELGERVGDLTLVAAQQFEAGRVVVFGDTSSFQYLAISRTHQFVEAVVSWLVSDRPSLQDVMHWCGVAGLALGGVLFLVLARRSPGNLVVLSLAVLLGLTVGSLVDPFVWGSREVEALESALPYAIIDTEHSPLVSVGGYTEDSLDGLVINLRRNGLASFFEPLSSQLTRESDMIVLVAPTRRLSDRVVVELREYMEHGGHVLVSAGYRSWTQVSPLLSKFGLRIRNLPLGPVPYVEESSEEASGPQFSDAFPIIWEGTATESLYSVQIGDQRFHLVVLTPVGSGGLITIADGSFLLNKNLEQSVHSGSTEWKHWPGNVAFLHSLFELLPDATEEP